MFKEGKGFEKIGKKEEPADSLKSQRERAWTKSARAKAESEHLKTFRYENAASPKAPSKSGEFVGKEIEAGRMGKAIKYGSSNTSEQPKQHEFIAGANVSDTTVTLHKGIKKEKVWNPDTITPEVKKMAAMAEDYARKAAEAELRGDKAAAERMRATAMIMRRAIDEHIEGTNNPRQQEEKKEKQAKRSNLVSGEDLQRLANMIVVKEEVEEEPVKTIESVSSETKEDWQKLRELKEPLALLTRAAKEAMNAAQAYQTVKPKGFFSRLFKGDARTSQAAEAKRLRDRYQDAALKVGQILYFTKREQLAVDKRQGKISMDEAKMALETYKDDEIMPFVQEEEATLKKIDQLLA